MTREHALLAALLIVYVGSVSAIVTAVPATMTIKIPGTQCQVVGVTALAPVDAKHLTAIGGKYQCLTR